MSFEEFRASLSRPDLRAGLGLQLSDAEAELVAADPASAQGWYSYWLSVNAAQVPPSPVIQPAEPAPISPAPISPAPLAAPISQAHNAATPPPATQTTGQPYGSEAAADDTQQNGGSPYPGYVHPSESAPTKKRNVGLWVTLSIIGAVLLIAIIVVVAAFATARHWTKVDVPEQPETFHSEDFETGRYDVTMDAINPCSVNQDWTDCTNLMVATYNAACVDVELTEAATLICTDYSGAIEEMKAADGEGFYVATLGTYGTLHRTPEMETREVSNDDYKPAVTHEAVCYLGFLGECE